MALVPFTLPGESVQVELGKGVEATLRGVTTSSELRQDPKCPLFRECGGCHYQHAPYSFQSSQKAEILREQLARVGKIRYEGEIKIVESEPWGYRNRVQLRVERGKLGYRAAASHRFVPLEGDCPVASPRLNRAIEKMRERMRDSRFPRFVQELELFTNETDVQVNILESERPVAQRFYQWCESVARIEYPTRHGVMRVGTKSFFQVNRFLVDDLVDIAVGGESGKLALDLYAGVGLFSAPLSRQFKRVIAVESGNGAIEDMVHNVPEADAIHARVEEYISSVDERPDLILADPPRAGIGKGVASQLNRIGAQRVVLVSCDAATLARDLAMLDTYELEQLTMVDLFPQTFHLETVARLRRRTLS